MNLILVGILGYVVLQLVVGMLVSRRVSSEEDYLLAGRSFGFGLATFSFFATWFGAETCIGAAGRIYEHGLAGASADPFGYGLCLLLLGLVFAAPLWRRRLTTLADLFRTRYSPGVERFAVLLMVPTSVLWAAAQVRAFGQVLDASSNIGVPIAISIAAGVAVIYTAAGGMRADVITDFIQGIMIIIGLAALVIAIVWQSDAISAGWAALDPARFNLFGGETASGGRSGQFLGTLEAWAIPICGSVVAQELVARVLSTRSAGIARRSALCGGGLYLLVGIIPALLGLVGVSLLPGLTESEQFLPTLAQKFLNPVVFVLFSGALVAAILSTVDSTLLAASSLTAHNLVIPLKAGLSERAKLKISRIGVACFGVIAWGLALQAESIFALVESASSFGSAGILVLVVFGLFTRVGDTLSAYAALALGTVVWLGGTLAGWEIAYLPALGSALGGYLLMSVIGRTRTALSSEACRPSLANTGMMGDHHLE